jgi:hypothetical protein
MLAWTMAAELPKVPLADGLELLLLANDVEPTGFDRAVPRWHARLWQRAAALERKPSWRWLP